MGANRYKTIEAIISPTNEFQPGPFKIRVGLTMHVYIGS